MIRQDRYVGSAHVHAVRSLHAVQSQRQEAGSFRTHGCTSLSCLASTHTSLQSAYVSNSMLPAAQATLIALPDELLGRILQCAWAETPWSDTAAEEVRRAADLASVCRRMRELLRAHPLPLALDFSAEPLSAAQRSWLLEPAQAGRVEAADFYAGVGTHTDALWLQPLLPDFVARHSGALLRLSGVPLQLVPPVSQEARSALVDLSGLRLTKLGLNCCNLLAHLLRMDAPPPACVRPECLPGGLEELELLGLHGRLLGWGLAWAPPQSGVGLAARLPRLHTLRLARVRVMEPLRIAHVALLEGLSVLPAFDLDGSGAIVSVHSDLFEQVRSVRIVAGACALQDFDDDDSDYDSDHDGDHDGEVTAVVDRLCHAGLQAAELRGADYVAILGPRKCSVTHEVVRDMISRYGDQFAVDVGGLDEPLDVDCGEKGNIIHRLAWRRWPAPDAPDVPAARAAHERARAWAAAGAKPHADMYPGVDGNSADEE